MTTADFLTGADGTRLSCGEEAAVMAVVGASIQFGVFGPTVSTANLSMTVATAPGYDHAATVALVQTAMSKAVNGGPMSAGLAYTSLIGTAYTVAGVVNVTAYTLNGGTADLPGTSGQVIRAGTIVVV